MNFYHSIGVAQQTVRAQWSKAGDLLQALLKDAVGVTKSHCMCFAMQVVVYHGPDRNRNTNWLKQQDVVITTYSTLAQEVSDDEPLVR
jgi:hypothetical protein